MIKKDGWNTWDVRAINAVVLLPEALELRFCLLDEDSGDYKREIRWKNLSHPGPHATDGSYASFEGIWRGNTLRFEYASHGSELVARITPLNISGTSLELVVEAFFNWNRQGRIETRFKTYTILESAKWWLAESLVAKARGRNLFIRSTSPAIGASDAVSAEVALLPEGSGALSFMLEGDIYVVCSPEDDVDLDESALEKFLQVRREKYEQEKLKGEGYLRNAEVITRGLMWNTFWEPVNNRIVTTESREWCCLDFHKGYHYCAWDTYLSSVLAAYEDHELAKAIIASEMDEFRKAGFAPHIVCGAGRSQGRSMPPVGAYCILKVYKIVRDIGILEANFDKLLGWHRWWFKARDGNKDGLLEWGANYDPKRHWLWQSNNIFAAKWEAGLDNSPIYDEVEFNRKTHTMELSDVGLNSLYALDAWALAEMAKDLGKEDLEAELRQDYEAMKGRINRELWSEDKGIYLNKDWQGRFSDRISPTSFYPLLAGIPTRAQAERMVKEHLLNPNEFWGTYVIPSVARNDPAFKDQAYFRGRIWGPLNFLVCEGLRRYRYDQVAYELSRKSLQLFDQEWEEESHVHENHDAVTGDGDGLASDTMYVFGTLHALMGVQELLDVEAWSGLRFGNLDEDKASISNVHVGKDLYCVEKNKSLKVERNGNVIIETSRPVIIRDFQEGPKGMSFSAEGGGEVMITVGDLPSGAEINLACDQKKTSAVSSEEGRISLPVLLPGRVSIVLGDSA